MRFHFFNKIISRFWRTVLLLVLLPVVELALMLYIFPGDMFTLLSMLAGGLLGAFFAYREGVRCWIEFNRQLDQGKTPTVPSLNGILILLGALFMIMPGLLTCLFGLFLLFPLTRFLVVTHIVLQFESYRLRTRGKASQPPETIDV